MSDEIKVRFTGDQTQLKATVGRVKSEISSIGKVVAAQRSAMQDLTKSVSGVLGAYVGIGAAVSEVTKLINKYSDIGDSATKTGLTPEFLQKLSNAAETAGAELETMVTGSLKLTKAIAFGKEADLSVQALSALGLNLEYLQSLNPEQQFTEVAKAVGNISDGGQRAAAAIAIFGKSGADLVPVLDDMKEGFADLPFLSGDDVGQIKEAGDMFTRLGQMIEASFAKGALAWKNNPLRELFNTTGPGAILKHGFGVDTDSWFKKDPSSPTTNQPAPGGVNADGDVVHARGRKANGVDFQAMLKAQEAKAASDKEQDRLNRLSGAAAKSAAADALKTDQEIAKNESDTAKARHDAALEAMDDEGRLQTMMKERGDLLKKYTGNESRLEKSELDKQLAAKDAEIAALQRSIASQSTDSEGGSPGPAVAPEPTRAPDEMRSLEAEFRANPANFNPDGTVKNGGALRNVQRSDGLAAARESRRRTRGLGSTPRPNPDDVRKNVGALFDKGDGMDRKRRPGEEAMGDGSKPTGGGSPADDKLDSIASTVKSMNDMLARRLPRECARP